MGQCLLGAPSNRQYSADGNSTALDGLYLVASCDLLVISQSIDNNSKIMLDVINGSSQQRDLRRCADTLTASLLLELHKVVKLSLLFLQASGN